MSFRRFGSDGERIAVVWLKRDIRLEDHAPLAYAIEEGYRVLIVFSFEPCLVGHEDTSLRHLRFQYESLLSLEDELAVHGGCLYIFHREMVSLLSSLLELFSEYLLLSHQETGVEAVRKRNANVRVFCEEQGIEWMELPNFGVLRGDKDRDGWEAHWLALMNGPQCEVELSRLRCVVLDDEWLEGQFGPSLPSGMMRCQEQFPKGGSCRARTLLDGLLDTFATQREPQLATAYLSDVVTSRLSAYIAWGNVSLRQVYQAVRDMQHQAESTVLIEAFLSRLRWHCHLIQMLESAPKVEYDSLNQTMDSVWGQTDLACVEAWKAGETGVPFVDAAMRCLRETGFVPFVMRGLLVSFLSHHLWQDWRQGVHHLARLFLDYEPGIHYLQCQIHASATGLFPLRILDPMRLAQELDPEGRYVHRWVPELQSVPSAFLHEPWRLSQMEQVFHQCVLGEDYPFPLVDLRESTRSSRMRLEAVRATERFVLEAKENHNRHIRKTRKMSGCAARQRRPSSATRQVPKEVGEGAQSGVMESSQIALPGVSHVLDRIR